MKKLERDDTDYAHEYYESGEVDKCFADLEAQLSDLEKLKLDISNALKSIAEYDQENASLKAQLLDAKQVANDCKIVADNAILEAVAAKKDSDLLDFLEDQQDVSYQDHDAHWIGVDGGNIRYFLEMQKSKSAAMKTKEQP